MDIVFFPLSKILWSLVRPEGWLLLLLLVTLIAVVLGRRRLALTGLGVAIAGYVLIALAAPGDWVLRPLERYASANPPLDAPAAIVVLGGAEEADRSVLSGMPSFKPRYTGSIKCGPISANAPPPKSHQPRHLKG